MLGAFKSASTMPTFLPAGNHSFHRNPATVELTSEGVDSPITRLLDDPGKNTERWRRLTYLADYQDAGSPKPGAVVLADLNAGHRKLPLLVTQNYGHGRSAILATGGTHAHLTSLGLEATAVKKVLEGRPHIVDAMKNGEVQIVFNTTEGRQSLEDSFSLRRAALMMKIPYYTTTAGALAAAQAIGAVAEGTLEVRSLQSYG